MRSRSETCSASRANAMAWATAHSFQPRHSDGQLRNLLYFNTLVAWLSSVGVLALEKSRPAFPISFRSKAAKDRRTPQPGGRGELRSRLRFGVRRLFAALAYRSA